MKSRGKGLRPGFSMIELMISMGLMLFVLGVATNMFRKQGNIMAQQSGRLEAQQTAQFTLATLDRELRLAGVGVADMQPILVQIDTMAVTFNADLVSTVLADPAAVYIDTAASYDLTAVFHSNDKKTLPLVSRQYPDSTYMKSVGAPSGAETISFWLEKDSSKGPSSKEFILYRRVNTGSKRVVARGIMKEAKDTIFEYFKSDSAGNLTAIQKSALPKYHDAVTHGNKADTGQYAIIDSIKTIRVRLRTVYHDRKGDVFRRLDMTIRLMNAGLIRRNTCGEAPLGVTPTATLGTDAAGAPFVTLAWTKSGDEDAGEKDIERYSIFKRNTGEGITFNEPFASVPAGEDAYTFTDTDVTTGQQWIYGVSAQDCSSLLSSVGSSAIITIP